VPRPASPAPSSPIGLQDTEPEIREYKDEVLTGRVRLDNASFVGCRFRQATLVYAGMGFTRLRGCGFEEVRFEFDGPAGRALAFLQAMSHPSSGLRDVVKASFPRIFGH
jgi:hypothetical protein